MPVTLNGSKWTSGFLKFFTKATGRSTLTLSTIGPGQEITRVDIDTQNAALSAATLLSGFLVHTSVTGGGTLTVDTGANLDAAFPEWQIGEVYSCFYLNDGTQTVTLTGATGTTALSAQTIATLQGRMIRFLKTAAATYSVWAD
jgi:hypothetical protein